MFQHQKKRKFDNISLSDSDYSVDSTKRLNTSSNGVSMLPLVPPNINLLKKNHVKKASGLSHEILSNLGDTDPDDDNTDNKSLISPENSSTTNKEILMKIDTTTKESTINVTSKEMKEEKKRK